MSDPTANDDRCLQGGSVELLATDGFVLLHALCGGALVELVINVSQERARALGEDAEPFLAEWFTPSLAAPHNIVHTDSPHEAEEHRPAHAINVLMALHDIPMAMGPTECARGSHFLTNHLSNPALERDELVYQHASTSPELLVNGTQSEVPESCSSPMTAGSCLVFDDRLMHRGLANRSDDTRYVAYFSYCKRGYSTNTHFESQRSVFDATD